MTTWPHKNDIIRDLLAVAESYTKNVDNLRHPEDIANSLCVAIEIAWRGIKPLNLPAPGATTTRIERTSASPGDTSPAETGNKP